MDRRTRDLNKMCSGAKCRDMEEKWKKYCFMNCWRLSGESS